MCGIAFFVIHYNDSSNMPPSINGTSVNQNIGNIKNSNNDFIGNINTNETAIIENNNLDTNSLEVTNEESINQAKNEQQNYTVSNDNETNNSNQGINISDINEANMNYNELKNELEKRGLKVTTNDNTIEVNYVDQLSGTTTCTIEDKYRTYNKGETVIVNRTNYKGKPITVGFNVRIGNIEHDKNLYCVLKEGATIYDEGLSGVQVYFDNKLVATITREDSFVSGVPAFKYTFSNEEKVKVKIVAPYTYKEEGSNYQNNVVLDEYDLKIKDIDDYNVYFLY